MDMDDILTPISDNDLLTFIKIAQAKLPKTLRAHHYLLCHYKWKKFKKYLLENTDISTRFRCDFYTHRSGDINNCTFVAISQGFVDYTIFAFSMEPSNRELDDCLKTTKRIHWTKAPLINSIEVHNSSTIEDIRVSYNINIVWSTYSSCLWMSRERASSLDTSCLPDNVKIGKLQPSDAKLIDDEWPHQYPGSYVYIHSQIVLNGGFGLYDRQTGRLLSWVLINDNFALGSLQTLESEKRKGYGEMVIKAACKAIAQDECLDVLAMVQLDNDSSQKLFRKVGFGEFNKCYWYKFEEQCVSDK